MEKKQISAVHTNVRTLPKNLAEADKHLFAHELSKQMPAVHLLTLKNVDVFDAYIFQKSKLKFYFAYTHNQMPSRKEAYKKALFSALKPVKKVEKAIWIVDNWSSVYFHWLTDALPRLLVASEGRQGHILILPKEYARYSYVTESLKYLDFADCLFFDGQERLFVKQILLPSHTASTGNYHREIIGKLRDKFLAMPPKIPTRKIYISRQKAQKRKIINEIAVTDLLAKYDFETHFFEDYDFDQQLVLMQETKVLLSLHGSGLTNMLFMPRDGQIVELRNQGDSQNNCFFSLASDLGHSYYYLLNEGDSQDTHFVNVTVNIQALEELLQTLEAKIL